MNEPFNLAALNARIAGFTVVRGLSLDGDMATGDYALRISLSKDERPASRVIGLVLGGVSGLLLQNVGGGVIYFSCLRVRDISAEQHDRILFEVVDLEDERISARAASVNLVEGPALPG